MILKEYSKPLTGNLECLLESVYRDLPNQERSPDFCIDMVHEGILAMSEKLTGEMKRHNDYVTRAQDYIRKCHKLTKIFRYYKHHGDWPPPVLEREDND